MTHFHSHDAISRAGAFPESVGPVGLTIAKELRRRTIKLSLERTVERRI